MTGTINNPTQAAFDLVIARPVAAPDLQHGRLVHLAWRAPEQGDRLVQFYLNGRLAGASRSPTQREAWLMVDPDTHNQIELLAVCPSQASVDRSECLMGLTPPTQPAVSFRLMRDIALPADSTLSVCVKGEAPADRLPLFSPSDPRGGFGAVFGEGGFGYDTSIGPGLGIGELGAGPLGSDGEALQWLNDTLPAGPYTISLLLQDRAGQPAADELGLALAIDRLPQPPSDVSIDDSLNLTWT